MAYLASNDKLQNQDPNAAGAQAGGQSVANGGTGQAVSGSGDAGQGYVSQGVSTAGVGSGGQGGWTNIQAYLNANQGNNASAGTFSKQANDTFDSEEKNASDSANQTKSQAQSQVSGNKIAPDTASQLISSAGQNYQYPNQTTTGAQPPSYSNTPQGSAGRTAQDPQAYNDSIGKLKGSLNAQYQGPSSYSRGMGADAQQIGDNLGSDQGWQGIMQGLYRTAAGGQIGTGALSLQNQLDTNNDALSQARQDAQSRYAGLQSKEQGLVTDTNTAARSAQGQFGQDQQDLKGYLQNLGQTEKGAVDNAESGYNQGVQNGIYDSRRLKSPFGADLDQNYTPEAMQRLKSSGWLDRNYDYQPGDQDGSMRVGGDDRDKFNSIQDALGMSGSKLDDHNANIRTGAYAYKGDPNGVFDSPVWNEQAQILQGISNPATFGPAAPIGTKPKNPIY